MADVKSYNMFSVLPAASLEQDMKDYTIDAYLRRQHRINAMPSQSEMPVFNAQEAALNEKALADRHRLGQNMMKLEQTNPDIGDLLNQRGSVWTEMARRSAEGAPWDLLRGAKRNRPE